jgi:histidinol-phosphate aminotransferase
MATSLTRRGFTQLLGLGAASSALRPALALAKTLPQAPQGTASGIVRLSSNENPYGPSEAALAAMRQAFSLAWRYPDEAADELAADLAKLHGVPADHILLGDGSSEILKLCADAFTGPGRSVVVAEPTFEAVARYAQVRGAEVVRVPLATGYRHDLDKMLPAGAGLVYVCNPNNPTASLTPAADLRAFLDRVPAGTAVLVDEAYAHYAEGRDWETMLPRIADHPGLIVARTFSKIYGMAGLRCGYAVAQPATIGRLHEQQSFDSINIMALAAARASIADAGHVETGRRRNREMRTFVQSGLESMGYPAIPSETNFLMTDLRKDVGPVIAALKQQGVEVGRRFPAMPTHLRVTVGTRPQMETFMTALRTVLA